MEVEHHYYATFSLAHLSSNYQSNVLRGIQSVSSGVFFDVVCSGTLLSYLIYSVVQIMLSHSKTLQFEVEQEWRLEI